MVSDKDGSGFICLILTSSPGICAESDFRDDWIEPNTGIEFVWLEGGYFDMGNASGEENQRPVHKVYLNGLTSATCFII